MCSNSFSTSKLSVLLRTIFQHKQVERATVYSISFSRSRASWTCCCLHLRFERKYVRVTRFLTCMLKKKKKRSERWWWSLVAPAFGLKILIEYLPARAYYYYLFFLGNKFYCFIFFNGHYCYTCERVRARARARVCVCVCGLVRVCVSVSLPVCVSVCVQVKSEKMQVTDER